MSTFSENFIQINQLWPQLQPKTWSEAILRMYKSLHHFITDSLQNLHFFISKYQSFQIEMYSSSIETPLHCSMVSSRVSVQDTWTLTLVSRLKCSYFGTLCIAPQKRLLYFCHACLPAAGFTTLRHWICILNEFSFLFLLDPEGWV